MAVVTLYCSGIMCDSELIVEIPDWTGTVDYDSGGHQIFCPKCKKQEDWFGSVCSGCVESYPECEMSRAWAYDNSPGLTEAQRGSIIFGKCPFRTNGTFATGPSYQGVETIDLSEIAPDGSGQAIVDAIERYWAEYDIPKQT